MGLEIENKVVLTRGAAHKRHRQAECRRYRLPYSHEIGVLGLAQQLTNQSRAYSSYGHGLHTPVRLLVQLPAVVALLALVCIGHTAAWCQRLAQTVLLDVCDARLPAAVK